MNLLFLNAGRRCELMTAFRNVMPRFGAGLVFASDVSELAPALQLADVATLFPPGDSDEFPSCLFRFCRENRIDLVIPTIDPDLERLDRIRDEFSRECPGTRLLLSPHETILLTRDKPRAMERFRAIGMETPNPLDSNEPDLLPYPVFVRPRHGSAGEGARIIRDRDELVVALRREPDLMVETYIEGPEFTVDVLCDFSGTARMAVARRRIKVRGGEVIQGVVDMRTDLLALARRAAEGFSCQGPVTVQFRMPAPGRFIAIEINARMGGGLPLSIAAGGDWPGAILAMVRGDEPALSPTIRNGLRISRYDMSVFIPDPVVLPNAPMRRSVTEQHVPPSPRWDSLRAVVFDLDETLYPERDFVFGGYRAVAQRVWNDHHVDIEPQLRAAFAAGARGDLFSRILADTGIAFDEDYVQILVKAYRRHRPRIKPYLDVVPVLDELKSVGFRIGLITDGFADVQRRKWNALRLADRFDAVVVSDELGGPEFWKPSNAPYLAILGHLGVSASESVYVADNPKKDFLACNRLGMHSIRVRRPFTESERFEPVSAEAAPEYEVTSLPEILPVFMAENRSFRISAGGAG